MDPESGTDAVRDVGITAGRIAKLSQGELRGRRVLDARGLVVAPGFIDLHQHGQNLEDDRLKAQDGVTTALELKIGVPDVSLFLKAREGRALVNYGTSASHPWARVLAWGGSLPSASGEEVLPAAGPATDAEASPEKPAAQGQLARTTGPRSVEGRSAAARTAARLVPGEESARPRWQPSGWWHPTADARY
jgi:hypothetical protein